MAVAAVIVGLALILCLLALSIYVPHPTPSQHATFRTVLALAGGAFSAVIPGTIGVELPAAVQAGGPLAVTVLLYWFSPKLMPSTSDTSAAAAEVVDDEAPAARATPLGAPEPGARGVLVDLSHGQAKWRSGSVFSLAEPQTLYRVLSPEAARDLRIGTITDTRQIDDPDLSRWSGLIVGLPYHRLMNAATRAGVEEWVRAGGRLLLMGFELGDRHHKANLNALAESFGLRFNTDIVAPEAWEGPRKPYNQPIDFAAEEPCSHDVIRGVGMLRLANVCTVAVEPGASVLVRVGRNGVGSLRDDAAVYVDGWLSTGAQAYDVTPSPRAAVVAEAPSGLTGSGRVVAIGTWDLFGRDGALLGDADNAAFVGNLILWLAARSS